LSLLLFLLAKEPPTNSCLLKNVSSESNENKNKNQRGHCEKERNGWEEILGWRKIKFEYPNTGMMMSTGCSKSTAMGLRPAQRQQIQVTSFLLNGSVMRNKASL